MSDSDEAGASHSEVFLAKWMTNALKQTRDRTRYVKMLESISSNPVVSYAKMIIGLGGFTLIVIVGVGILISSSHKFMYTGVWVIAGMVASLSILALYVLPSRGGSLLVDASKLVLCKWVARSTGSHSKLLTIGVDKVETDDATGYGLLSFTGGGVGFVFRVDGVVGLSTLPAIADRARVGRYQYFVSRSDTTQETLITNTVSASFETQLKNLRRDLRQAQAGNSVDDQWRGFMLQAMSSFIRDNLSNNATLLEQFLILRDEDTAKLRASVQRLEDAVELGAYAHVRGLNSSEVQAVLAGLVSSQVRRK